MGYQLHLRYQLKHQVHIAMPKNMQNKLFNKSGSQKASTCGRSQAWGSFSLTFKHCERLSITLLHLLWAISMQKQQYKFTFSLPNLTYAVSALQKDYLSVMKKAISRSHWKFRGFSFTQILLTPYYYTAASLQHN